MSPYDSEMRYRERYTKPFLKDVKVIKKDKVLLDRVNKKIDQIRENPEHYQPKRYDYKRKKKRSCWRLCDPFCS